MSESDFTPEIDVFPQEQERETESPSEVSKPAETIEEIKMVLERAIKEGRDIFEVLDYSDIVILGERHNDYAIPEYLLGIVSELKKKGVVSFGFEIPVTDANLKIIEEINNGNLDAVKKIDWSLGYGHTVVRQLKEQFVRELAKSGIKIYAYAHWGKGFPLPYSEESERKAAEVIRRQGQNGKTLVLAGGAHAALNKRRIFPNFAQVLKQLEELSVTTISFQGGMRDPLEYDRSPSALVRRAMRRLKVESPILVLRNPIKGIETDGIIVLPEKPFMPASKLIN